MRIACPQCTSEFTVPAGALTEKPREVRCSKCNNQWKVTINDALPDSGTGEPVAQQPASPPPMAPPMPAPAPQMAKPAPQPAPQTTGPAQMMAGTPMGNALAEAPAPLTASPLNDPNKLRGIAQEAAVDGDDGSVISKRNARIMWGSYSALVFVLLAGFLLSHKFVIAQFPGSAYYYSIVGLNKETIGRGLEITEPSIELEQTGNVKLYVAKGTIRNVTNEDINVPHIRAGYKDKKGNYLEQKWYFKPNDEIIGAGATISYTTQFTEIPEGAFSLVFVFVSDIEAENGL